jgi:hypothetical protein
MRRHLSAAAAGVAFGEIFQTELMRCHAASEHESAIAIIGNDEVIPLHLDRDRRQRLVTHPGNVKVSLTLAN